jgi:hypothetical protein
MRKLADELRFRITDANKYPHDSKQRRACIGTAYNVLQGTLRIWAVHPQDERYLRAILDAEGVPAPRGCEPRPGLDEED